MVKVASLEADIKINSGDASKKLDEINKKLDNLDTASEKTARNTSLNWVTAVGSLMNGAAKVISFLDEQAGKVRQVSFEYGKLTRITGHSAKEFQKWKAIIEQSGGSFDDFMASLDNLRKIKANFMMTGNVPEVFGRLGIMPTGEDIDILQQVTEKLKGIQDIATRNYLASQAGISPDLLGILLNTGGKGYFDERFALTEEEIKRAQEVEKESRVLSQKMDAIIQKLGSKWLAVTEKLNTARGGILNTVAGWLDDSPTAEGDLMAFIMRKEGLSDEAIAGILGNASVESTFDPKKENGSHRGLFQWDRNRWGKYQEFITKNGKEDNIVSQMTFMMRELKARGQWDKVNSATSAARAAELFEGLFEVSGGQKLKERVSRAESAYEMMKAGVPITAAGIENYKSSTSAFSPSGGVYSNVSNYNNEFGGNRNIYVETTYNVSTNKFDGNSVKEADGDIEKKVAAAVSK